LLRDLHHGVRATQKVLEATLEAADIAALVLAALDAALYAVSAAGLATATESGAENIHRGDEFGMTDLVVVIRVTD
jgi:hypothetical protein